MRIATAFLLLASATFADIIPAARLAQWSSAGIDGGIPSRTTIYTTISAGASHTTINSALNSCPANQVVKLGAGTFNLTGSIDFQSAAQGVVLRGSGSDPTTGTKIISDGSPCIQLRKVFNEGSLATDADITANITKGDTVITVGGGVPSWVTVGELMGIDQINDEVLDTVTTHREGAGIYRNRACCGSNGERGRGEIVKVLSKTATTITIELPMISPYTTAQTAQIFKPAYDVGTAVSRKGSGIEDLYVEAFQIGNGNAITVANTDSCWIKNVYSYKVSGYVHVQTEFVYRLEVRDCYFYDSFKFNAGQGYGVALYDISCYCRIENNIFRQLHVSMQANYGSSGNVFGYNYVVDGKSDVNEEPSINVHGNSAQFNLFEGNYCQGKAMFDCIHGSNSTNTIFRNRLVGRSNLTNTNGQLAYDIDYWNKNSVAVGNILGLEGYHTIFEQNAPDAGSSGQHVIKRYGYVNAYGADTTGQDGFPNAYQTKATLDPVDTGNYDYVNDAIQWDGSGVQTIPSTLYLSGKPSWFGILSWPPFDPSTTTTANNAVVVSIPAGYRYTNGSNPPSSSQTGGMTGNAAISGNASIK